MEELLTTTEKLKEKENSLSSAELEVAALNRRVQGIEGDLETCEDKLLLASQKLDKAATAADDSDRMRKVLESRAIQDEDRMAKLEEELKSARNQAEDADKKYDEVQKKLGQTETDLERAEERAEVGEIKIVELEAELSLPRSPFRSCRRRWTGLRTSWPPSRRSSKRSLRSWRPHSLRCPDTRRSRNSPF